MLHIDNSYRMAIFFTQSIMSKIRKNLSQEKIQVLILVSDSDYRTDGEVWIISIIYLCRLVLKYISDSEESESENIIEHHAMDIKYLIQKTCVFIYL